MFYFIFVVVLKYIPDWQSIYLRIHSSNLINLVLFIIIVIITIIVYIFGNLTLWIFILNTSISFLRRFYLCTELFAFFFFKKRDDQIRSAANGRGAAGRSTG